MKIVPLMQLINDERQTFLGNAELLYLFLPVPGGVSILPFQTISEVS